MTPRRLVGIALLTAYGLLLTAGLAQAAVSKGKNQQLSSGGTNQGGSTVKSSKYVQQISVGDAVAGTAISTSRFRIVPGILASEPVPSKTKVSETDLDLPVLYAKTEPLGTDIIEKSWQTDKDPIFIWEAPADGLNVAGYSYALDAAPDDTVDTATTSYNIATSQLGTLADGTHTFSVKAVDTAGKVGNARAVEVWVDTTPPSILNYSPSPGALLNTKGPTISATVSDAASGVTAAKVTVLINGSAGSVTYDPATGVIASTGSLFKEGKNSMELRVADAVGNAQTPVLWSVTVDTIAPSGTLTVNGGATMTTSIYVTLGMAASDATSGVSQVLISNAADSGYVEEPFVSLRELWKLLSVRGIQRVYVKFKDTAGNISVPLSDDIELVLLAPETVITSGPAGILPDRTATFTFMCPEGGCLFSYAFDNQPWSAWSAETTATIAGLPFGNHYFRVKAAKEVNGTEGIQLDEEDPTPAERTWIIGLEPTILTVPKGPPIKLWRIE